MMRPNYVSATGPNYEIFLRYEVLLVSEQTMELKTALFVNNNKTNGSLYSISNCSNNFAWFNKKTLKLKNQTENQEFVSLLSVTVENGGEH